MDYIILKIIIYSRVSCGSATSLSKISEFSERAVLNWEDDHGNIVLHIAISKNES